MVCDIDIQTIKELYLRHFTDLDLLLDKTINRIKDLSEIMTSFIQSEKINNINRDDKELFSFFNKRALVYLRVRKEMNNIIVIMNTALNDVYDGYIAYNVSDESCLDINFDKWIIDNTFKYLSKYSD